MEPETEEVIKWYAMATEPSRRFHYFAATELSRIDISVVAK